MINFLKGTGFTLQILTEPEEEEKVLEILNDANSREAFSGSQLGRLPLLNLKQSDPDNLILAICEDIGGKQTIIGRISLENISYINQNAELKIIMRPDRHKKGTGTKACQLIIDHAFNELNLRKIYAGTLETNTGFQKLAAKLGFIEEGRRKQTVYKNGKFLDIIEYGLIKPI